MLVMKPFEHHHEMLQAAYRVGRSKDKCRRVLISGVELIDQEAAIAYKKRLLQFIEGVERQRRNKANTAAKSSIENVTTYS